MKKVFFNDMMTPYLGLSRDNNLRTDTSLEKLAKLKPSFDKNRRLLNSGQLYSSYGWCFLRFIGQ